MRLKKKYQLRREYDDSLLLLMKKLREDWEMSKRIERSSIEKDGHLFAQTKLAEAKFFYLFKEARHRNIKGDLTGKY
ncbi:YaaL family protein [Desemzia sp. RIT804]|uniref:YaaL family protein n=1 Tax=Desemzia sp. RIT 804 TaxID=2810209 RepID=UPI00194E2930|nr:YaaL family protein [Desemzia sp. RIT 804]MBM6616006.1 YaaL family protein [Desemzia sp. RIT 804]